ncbi:MAG: polysaccharide deacetylase family protein [Thermomicrobiales bacterium]|nr:polysaccharide deacetylase family protein [Thermomicrobiales bacterium]
MGNPEETNARLGFPADARLLIINADDFGMCHAANAATIQAMRAGIVSSTTVMTPCPWAPHALRLLAENPDLAFGVHLTLIAEHTDYRWGPRAPRGLVPSLIDASGYFYRNDQRDALLAQAVLNEVEIEFRAQIAPVLAAGLSPTHLDWHCLADGGRTDIFALTMALAKEFGLALRVHAPASAERAQRAGFRTSDHGVLDSYSLAADDKSAQYIALLRDLPAGLSEWALHPSLGDAEAQAMEPSGWQVRKADFDFLISAQAQQTLAEEGIELVDFRRLQSAGPA